MAGSVSISKPNRSEASLQPELLKKSVSEFRLNITREVRMRRLRLETPSKNAQLSYGWSVPRAWQAVSRRLRGTPWMEKIRIFYIAM